MNQQPADELDAVRTACLGLIDRQQSLLMSCVDEEGQPELSYAPFAPDGEMALSIFVSELASHTTHLRRRGQVCVMLIQPEAEARNPFARERLILQCRAIEMAPDHLDYETKLTQLERRVGETVALLRSLPDFHLFVLQPTRGRYIAGFGRAYDLQFPGCKPSKVVPTDR